MSAFLAALRSGRVLLMDGATGTELRRAGLPDDAPAEAWNLSHPERVAAVHRAYRDAGAEVVVANTFLATDEAVLRAGVELARPGFVLASVGPGLSPSYGKRSDWQQWQAHRAAMFEATAGADARLLETQTDFGGLQAFFTAGPPALLSVTYLRTPPGIRTIGGLKPEAVARRAVRNYPTVAALGVNCGRDLTVADCAEVLRRYRSVCDLPLFARPNAGTPTRADGGWVYPLTPAMLADELPLLLEAGAAMVGGCCGTKPEHIAACRPVVDAWNRRG